MKDKMQETYTEEEQLLLVKHNPYTLTHFKNPSELVCLTAAKVDKHIINSIANLHMRARIIKQLEDLESNKKAEEVQNNLS